MEAFITAFITEFAPQILSYILYAAAGYLGILVAKFCKIVLTDSVKKDVAKTVVRAVEQIFKDIHGDAKLQKALEYAETRLKAKGLKFDADEMKLLIEGAVKEMNEKFNQTYHGPQQCFTESAKLDEVIT